MANPKTPRPSPGVRLPTRTDEKTEDHHEERDDGASGFLAEDDGRVTAEATQTSRSFHNGVHEDVDNLIKHFERVAQFSNWTEPQMLDNEHFSLNDVARSWFENHEVTLTSWALFQ